MKKKLVVFLFAICILALNLPINNVSAQTIDEIVFESSDQIFENTIDEFKQYRHSKLNYDKQPLFDISFNEIGYYYFFSLDEESGYAISIGTSNTGYNVEEIFFDCPNPINEDELPVYVGSMTLLAYKNGVYKDARTKEVILVTNDYYGTYLIDSYSEYVYYDRKSTASVVLNYKVPFYSCSTYLDSCANIAGAIIVGYYDRIYSYLIPNFNSYDYSANRFSYDSLETLAVTDQLHFDMQTNIYGGTTVQRFLSGLQTYLTRANNRTLAYNSVLTSGIIDYNKLQLSFSQERPVVLFLNGYNIINDYYDGNDGSDYFMVANYGGGHAMVAYGYKNISYYRIEMVSVWSPVWYNPFRYVKVAQEVNFRNDTYLLASTGVGGYENSYVRMNQNNQNIDQALSIYVY